VNIKKVVVLTIISTIMVFAWDKWWKKPPQISYYKKRSYDVKYTQYDRIFLREGKRWGISPIFLKAIATQETGINLKLRDNGNNDGSTDIGLMRINNIHRKALWQYKQWTLSDMRDNPNRAVHYAAKVLSRCIRIYGMEIGNYRKMANTFSCYNGSQRFFHKGKNKMVGDPQLIYGKKILYHISMYNEVGSPLVEGDPVIYDLDLESVKGNEMSEEMLDEVENISQKDVHKDEDFLYFPWTIRAQMHEDEIN